MLRTLPYHPGVCLTVDDFRAGTDHTRPFPFRHDLRSHDLALDSGLQDLESVFLHLHTPTRGFVPQARF
jgi:hypothetical protein